MLMTGVVELGGEVDSLDSARGARPAGRPSRRRSRRSAAMTIVHALGDSSVVLRCYGWVDQRQNSFQGAQRSHPAGQGSLRPGRHRDARAGLSIADHRPGGCTGRFKTVIVRVALVQSFEPEGGEGDLRGLGWWVPAFLRTRQSASRELERRPSAVPNPPSSWTAAGRSGISRAITKPVTLAQVA